jgi:ketosteroid isomerase-like protein
VDSVEANLGMLLKIVERFLFLALCGAWISGCSILRNQPFCDECAVRDCHAVWFAGLLEEDIQKLDQVLADDVTLSFPDGSLWKKSDFLDVLRSGELEYDAVDEEEEKVRLHDRVAVVNGMATLQYTYRGESDEESLRYTAVYVRPVRDCKMVAWHSTDRGNR